MAHDARHLQLALAAAALVPLIWGTFWLTTSRKHRSGAPSVPYLIPWLGSGPELGKDPDSFIDRCSRKYGEIFAVKLGGNTLHYVTSPHMISQVWRQSQAMQKKKKMEAIWSQTVFGVSKEGAEAWHEVGITNIISKYLAPLNVDEVLKLYCVEVVRHMQPVVDSSGPAFTTHLDAFLSPLFFRITSRTFFGPEFPAEAVYPPFTAFDAGFSRLAAALPQVFARGAYAGRTAVAQQLKDYAGARHTACGAVAQIEDGARAAGLGADDVAGYLFAALWPLTANVASAASWALYLLMRDAPRGLGDLQAEIDGARAAWTAAHPGADPFSDADALFDFFRASKFPYFDSLFKEVLRVMSSSYSVRRVEQDGAVLVGDRGEVFTFREDDTIMCTLRATHFDDDVYADAHRFVPERFIADVRRTKNGKELPNAWMAFGGGMSICSGRHIAAAEVQLVIIWILSHFQVRLESPTQPPVRRDLSKVGFGIAPPMPQDDPCVVLTKRRAKA